MRFSNKILVGIVVSLLGVAAGDSHMQPAPGNNVNNMRAEAPHWAAPFRVQNEDLSINLHSFREPKILRSGWLKIWPTPDKRKPYRIHVPAGALWQIVEI